MARIWLALLLVAPLAGCGVTARPADADLPRCPDGVGVAPARAGGVLVLNDTARNLGRVTVHVAGVDTAYGQRTPVGGFAATLDALDAGWHKDVSPQLVTRAGVHWQPQTMQLTTATVTVAGVCESDYRR